jgi:hypothetical protein
MSARPEREQQAALAALYAERPGEFVAARKRAVDKVKERDPELARWLASRRKPTPVLWAVNALAREADVELGKLLDLRKLGPDRRELLNRLVARAAAILEREGSRATPAVERRIRSVLSAAAIAEPAVRDQLRKGALSTELDTGDLDLGATLASSVAAAGARPAPRTTPAKARAEQQAEAARRQSEQRRARAAAKLEQRAATVDARAAKLRAELDRVDAEAKALRAKARTTREPKPA